jgi:hypothetical protein
LTASEKIFEKSIKGLAFLKPLCYNLACTPETEWIVGVDGDEGTPVPIPNTEVKPICAEDTWLETAWENRTIPTPKTSGLLAGRFSVLDLKHQIFGPSSANPNG